MGNISSGNVCNQIQNQLHAVPELYCSIQRLNNPISLLLSTDNISKYVPDVYTDTKHHVKPAPNTGRHDGGRRGRTGPKQGHLPPGFKTILQHNTVVSSRLTIITQDADSSTLVSQASTFTDTLQRNDEITLFALYARPETDRMYQRIFTTRDFKI